MKAKYITHVIPSTKYKLVNLNQVFADSHIEHVKNIFENQLSNKSIIKKYFKIDLDEFLVFSFNFDFCFLCAENRL